MHIAIDLRPLNYPILTGVNIYALHFLEQLYKLKLGYPELVIAGLGLNNDRRFLLEKDFPFLQKLFSYHLPLSEYLQTPFRRVKALNGIMAILGYLFKKYNSQKLPKFDYLFLLQPKPLWKNPGTKQICVFHDIYSSLEPHSTNLFNRFYVSKRLYGLIAQESEKVWSVSLSTAWDLVRFLAIPESKIRLVYSGKPYLTSLSSARPDTNLPVLPKNYILVLSGIEKRKNWHNLLLANAVLQAHRQDYYLVLAGRVVDKSYYNELQKMIRRLNIANVLWILNPNELQKEKLISNSLFLAYPSFYEGFGFPILESFAGGKCVLTSRISSMPEIAKDAGLYVNPLNFQDIARGMEILLANHDLKNQLERNIPKNLRKFDWSEVYRALKNTLIHSS